MADLNFVVTAVGGLPRATCSTIEGAEEYVEQRYGASLDRLTDTHWQGRSMTHGLVVVHRMPRLTNNAVRAELRLLQAQHAAAARIVAENDELRRRLMPGWLR